MPLWDMRLIEFWNSIPYEYKLDKKLLKEFMLTNFNIPISQANPNRNLITKINDKLISISKLARYNGNLNTLKSIQMKNRDISEYVHEIPL